MVELLFKPDVDRQEFIQSEAVFEVDYDGDKPEDIALPAAVERAKRKATQMYEKLIRDKRLFADWEPTSRGGFPFALRDEGNPPYEGLLGGLSVGAFNSQGMAVGDGTLKNPYRRKFTLICFFHARPVQVPYDPTTPATFGTVGVPLEDVTPVDPEYQHVEGVEPDALEGED